MFRYKGFIGKVVIDEDEKMLVGQVINLSKDGIDFSGKTVEEAQKDFQGAVDDYLAWAEEDGFEPEKPYQGNILVRATPELHREAAIASTDLGISLNNFVIEAIQEKLRRPVTRERASEETLPVPVGWGSPPYALAGLSQIMPGVSNYFDLGTVRVHYQEYGWGSALTNILSVAIPESFPTAGEFESATTPRHEVSEVSEEASESATILQFRKKEVI
jgi:predicted HicB family RNase H-like nuclease